MSGSAAAFCVTFKLANRAIYGAILGLEETFEGGGYSPLYESSLSQPPLVYEVELEACGN
jgi:hypothetical protein